MKYTMAATVALLLPRPPSLWWLFMRMGYVEVYQEPTKQIGCSCSQKLTLPSWSHRLGSIPHRRYG
jgi:hypothetical protein